MSKTYKRVVGGWEGLSGGDGISEGGIGVRELGSQEAVHARVEGGDFQVSEEHADGFVVVSIYFLEVGGGGEDHIHHDVCLLVALLNALVDAGEHVEVIYGRSIKVLGVKHLGGREEAREGEGGEQHVEELRVVLEVL